MKKFFLILTLFLLTTLLAQNRFNHFGNWNDFNDCFNYNGKPFLELIYGNATVNHKNFIGNFDENGYLEFKVGYSDINFYDNILVQMDEKYFLLSKARPELHYDFNSKSFTRYFKFLQIGVGKRSGFGYAAGVIKFIPFTSHNFAINNIKLIDNLIYLSTPLNYGKFREVADQFDSGSYKFNYQSGAGVRLGIGKMINITGEYNFATVYPQIKTWKLLGSFVIQHVTLNIISDFVDEIEFSSPEAMPIINFILKTAINYSFYEFRKDGNTWPFTSEKPLSFEYLSFGITLTF